MSEPQSAHHRERGEGAPGADAVGRTERADHAEPADVAGKADEADPVHRADAAQARAQAAEHGRAEQATQGQVRRQHPRRPASLTFDPAPPATGGEDRFFDLESMDDPQELLVRATELALAFRAAAERATEFQAIAAAQLADPRRFDRLTAAALAERAGWTEDYARRMVEYGRGLIRDGGVTP